MANVDDIVRGLTVHFIAVWGDSGEDSACGLWNPPYMTGDWRAVNCGACRRGRRYRAAQREETTFFLNYQSPDLARLLSSSGATDHAQ